MTSEKVQQWQLDDLKSEVLRTLQTGTSSGDGNLVDGRALAVKASPLKANSSEIVVGTAALPPGFKTKPHSHAAEEIALVLGGMGSSKSVAFVIPSVQGPFSRHRQMLRT